MMLAYLTLLCIIMVRFSNLDLGCKGPQRYRVLWGKLGTECTDFEHAGRFPKTRVPLLGGSLLRGLYLGAYKGYPYFAKYPCLKQCQGFV